MKEFNATECREESVVVKGLTSFSICSELVLVWLNGSLKTDG